MRLRRIPSRLSSSPRRTATAAAGAVLVVLALALQGGCSARSFFDQSEVGAYPDRGRPLLVPILDKLDTGYEEGDERFATATNVRPGDLVPHSRDYVISKNDLLLVSITDLLGPGIESFKQPRVSESGNISLPYIRQIRAEGLTEAQLEEAIATAYRDMQLVQNAQVSVQVQEARGRTFTMAGSVAGPGQYGLFQSDFRILDAIALARGVLSPEGTEYIYVIGRVDQEPATVDQPPDLRDRPATQPADVLTPEDRQRQGRAPAGGSPVTLGKRVAMLKTQAQDPRDPLVPADQPEQAETAAERQPTQPAGEREGREGRIIVIDGKEVRVDGMQPAANDPPPMEEVRDADVPPSTQGFEFNELDEPGDVRVIRIPYDSLRRGELRYNIVVRPGDMIIVPDPVIGEYYMGGHVQRTGVYSLNARKITLKQAVIAAGMLDQLAVPWRTQVTRRIASNEEITVSVNLTKIFAGQEPDFYLKPYDSVMVGTDFWAPFLAAARNGFRITYGFGFLYDRNYAPDQNR